MMAEISGTCPYCKQIKTFRGSEEKNFWGRQIHKCNECGNVVLYCVAGDCNNMVKRGYGLDTYLCGHCQKELAKGVGKVLRVGLPLVIIGLVFAVSGGKIKLRR